MCSFPVALYGGSIYVETERTCSGSIVGFTTRKDFSEHRATWPQNDLLAAVKFANALREHGYEVTRL